MENYGIWPLTFPPENKEKITKYGTGNSDCYETMTNDIRIERKRQKNRNVRQKFTYIVLRYIGLDGTRNVAIKSENGGELVSSLYKI